jgi:hypothetical protein
MPNYSAKEGPFKVALASGDDLVYRRLCHSAQSRQVNPGSNQAYTWPAMGQSRSFKIVLEWSGAAHGDVPAHCDVEQNQSTKMLTSGMFTPTTEKIRLGYTLWL